MSKGLEERKSSYRGEILEAKACTGKTGLLGVPTVVDRMLCQAVGQVSANRFEMDFEDYSYRPDNSIQIRCKHSVNPVLF